MRRRSRKGACDPFTADEVTKLLEQLSGANPKEIRDKAMLELFICDRNCVTELCESKASDVNMSIGFITLPR